ncbi:hypothetical protein TNCV_1852041 [Trichonephila clavipes]|nr:hypothetical protein TNCV_1852041 [Trichonephila clavipes]
MTGVGHGWRLVVRWCSNVSVCKSGRAPPENSASLRQVGALNSHLAASPLVTLVEGEERWEPLTTPRVFSLKLGWN